MSNYLPKIKILIVDDRQENLLSLQAIFRDRGYELYEALSGKAAFELAKLHDFACILLDVQMPVLDGFETAKALRRLPRTELTPIIFVTAIDRTEEFEEDGYVAGAVDYLFKPINAKILQAKVSVFVDMFLQSEELRRKNILLEEAITRSKENEELKKALKMRDDFLTMASHELKTPITPLFLQMQTFIDLFESGAVASVPPGTLNRMLRTSHNQLERLSRLIHELVDVSKLSANKLELNKQEMSLTKLVRKLLSDFDSQIKNSGCEITLDAPNEVIGVWDSFRIEQVVVNLITNAMKYGECKPISIVISEHSGKALFRIQDFGIGIAPEDHARIFERYERAVSVDSYAGLGLGLFISREIISLHQGSIRVDSRPGEGAIFTVSLPL